MIHLDTNFCWDGSAAHPGEVARLAVCRSASGLLWTVDAPYHHDPPPPGPPGSTWKLWEHEVVELFIVGPDTQYTELEVGPHGHYLALRLQGVRHVVQRECPLDTRTVIDGDRWRAQIEVPAGLLPPEPWRANGFAIHGVGEGRRYLVHTPLGTEVPDFHRVDRFAPFEPPPPPGRQPPPI